MEEKELMFIGDTHGDLSNFYYNMNRNLLDDGTFIHVGDFGAGFNKKRTTWLNKINLNLAKHNIHMYVIRGNHDDPSFFQGNHEYSNLILLKDYTILEIQGRKILLVGGAISVDRLLRIQSHNKKYGATYWYNEEFVLQKDFLKTLDGITDVVTHTAPIMCYPNSGFPSFVHSYALEDMNLLNELEVERTKMQEMYEILKENNNINNWYYGHFHASHTQKIDGTKFTLLNINEIK